MMTGLVKTRAIRYGLLLALLAVAVAGVAGGCKKPDVRVRNPDYVAWAAFAPGSYVTFQGVQKTSKGEQSLRMTDKLLSKDDEKVILERTITLLGDKGGRKPQVRRRAEFAQIDPADHPVTHPSAKLKVLGKEDVEVAGKTIRCEIREVRVRTKLDDLVRAEQDMTIRVHRSEVIPGAMARVVLRTKTDEHTSEVTGRVVEYKAVAEKDK